MSKYVGCGNSRRTTQNQGGGDKKQGIAPHATHWYIANSTGSEYYTKSGDGRNRFHLVCLNQLGGIGRGRSQFRPNADGARGEACQLRGLCTTLTELREYFKHPNGAIANCIKSINGNVAPNSLNNFELCLTNYPNNFSANSFNEFTYLVSNATPTDLQVMFKTSIEVHIPAPPIVPYKEPLDLTSITDKIECEHDSDSNLIRIVEHSNNCDLNTSQVMDSGSHIYVELIIFGDGSTGPEPPLPIIKYKIPKNISITNIVIYLHKVNDTGITIIREHIEDVVAQLIENIPTVEICPPTTDKDVEICYNKEKTYLIVVINRTPRIKQEEGISTTLQIGVQSCNLSIPLVIQQKIDYVNNLLKLNKYISGLENLSKPPVLALLNRNEINFDQ